MDDASKLQHLVLLARSRPDYFVLYFVECPEHEVFIARAAGVRFNRLADFAAPSCEAAFALFVRPQAFEGPLPDKTRAREWAVAELGEDGLGTDGIEAVLDLAVPGLTHSFDHVTVPVRAVVLEAKE